MKSLSLIISKICAITLLFILNSVEIKSQSSISLKLNSFTYQFSETQPDILKMSLSENGKFALEPGIFFSYDYHFGPELALHLSQSLILDKASQLAGGNSIMLKLRVFKHYKHSLYLSFGSSLHYRKNWNNIEGYQNESIYNETGDWQYKLSWLSGQIEYNYYISNMSNLSISLLHIQAESIGFAAGIKYWIKTKKRKKRGCISCPGLH